LSPLLPHLLGAGAAPAFLIEVVILIVAGAGIAYLCHRVGLVPIVGFLVTGVLIGPYGLGLVQDRMLVDATAELGVVLLLFTIGIEFSLEKLARIKGLIFGGGGLQVGLTTAAVAGILLLFGVSWPVGIFTGFLVALSSTAIVLKLLADKGETSRPHGQVALGFLIFQDLAIIVMVLLVPLLASMGEGGAASGGGEGGMVSILLALGKATALILVVLLFARRLMPPLLERVARTCSPELFLLTLIAICLGTALVTSLAGVSLSLGAFLAGLLVSESRFSEHALGEILPLQILFSATFFISVGMLLDLRFVVLNLPVVAATLLVVLGLKILTSGVSALALGYPLPAAAASALILAQVGEFSFVLEKAGRAAGLFPAGMAETGSQIFIATTVVLMVLTPALASLGTRLQRRLEDARPAEPEAEPEVDPSVAEHLEHHVIVAGFGQAARRLVRALRASGIPFVVTTLSPSAARAAEAEGLPVVRGYAYRLHTLLAAGLERAKLLVIPDDEPAMAARIAAVARTASPTVRIVARSRYIAEIEPLSEHGIDRVVTEELESIVQLFATVLRNYQIDAEEIETHERELRQGGYAALREAVPAAGRVSRCTLDAGRMDQRTLTLREGMPAVGQPVTALDLGSHGLQLRAVRRGNTFQDPAAHTLEPGDEIVLAGSAGAFRDAGALFQAPLVHRPRAGSEGEEPASGIDVEALVQWSPRPVPGKSCSHLDQVRAVFPSAAGCEACLRIGHRDWVHLRMCMTCGHVGCCDNSPGRHAREHFEATRHPVMRAVEPGDERGFCYLDEVVLIPKGE
jgi:CPA2 family monovalent cation:H+ antiporter-2